MSIQVNEYLENLSSLRFRVIIVLLLISIYVTSFAAGIIYSSFNKEFVKYVISRMQAEMREGSITYQLYNLAKESLIQGEYLKFTLLALGVSVLETLGELVIAIIPVFPMISSRMAARGI